MEEKNKIPLLFALKPSDTKEGVSFAKEIVTVQALLDFFFSGDPGYCQVLLYIYAFFLLFIYLKIYLYSSSLPCWRVEKICHP